MKISRISWFFTIFAVLLHPETLQAQQLEEILVTARKRTESLQDVGLSVAVVSGAELAALSKTQIADLTRLVPGFTFASGTSDAGRSIVMRGVGTQSFSRSVDQSVGTVIDGVASGSLAGSILDFSDVERVEVLRGPQGMLFGKNASAGLLSITTNNPTEEIEAGFGATYGDKNLLTLNGYASGALVEDKLLGRVAVYKNTMDAILENKYPGGKDYNDRDEWGARVKLRWLVTEDLDALFSYTHAKRDHRCCIGPLRVVEPGSIADQLGGERGFKAETVLDNDTSTGTTELDGYSLTMDYSLGEFMFTSVTAFTEEDVSSATRGDLYTRTALPFNDGDENYKQFTQEIRVTSPGDRTLSYVAGLYYFDKKIKRDFIRVIDLYGIGALPQPDTGTLSSLNYPKTNNESLSAFGQLTWNITELSRLSFGARYNNEELSIDQTVGFVEGSAPEAPPGSIDAQDSDKAVSWRIIGEHDITSDAMVYASVARGYKGPGSNSLPSGPSSTDVFVDPEIPTNYEVGLKSQWLDNRVRFNIAAYYTEFKDFQASAQAPDAFPPLFFLVNAGELETKGVEIESYAQLTENLLGQFSMAYTDATFSDWQDAPCYARQTLAEGCVDGEQDLSGADMPDSPDWSFNLGLTYNIPMDSQPFDGFVRGSYFWQDEVQFDTTNNPIHIGDSYGTLNLYTGISAHDGRYTVQLFVQNLFDEFYTVSISGQQEVGILAGHGLAYDYTRRFGVSLRMNF